MDVSSNIQKVSEAAIYQLFDSKGNLISQECKIVGNSEYTEVTSGKKLDLNDERLHFYAPYNMVQSQDDLIKRIVNWNIKRDNLKFSHYTETRLLAEELYEFLGYADSKTMGIDFAGQSCKNQYYDENGNIVLLYNDDPQNAVTLKKSDLADAAGDLVFIAIGTIAKLGLDPYKVLKTICDHNDAKGNTKDAYGKIIKDSTFIEPQHT